MKKIITAFSVLSFVAACANTKESTLEDFWRDAIGEEQTLSNNCSNFLIINNWREKYNG